MNGFLSDPNILILLLIGALGLGLLIGYFLGGLARPPKTKSEPKKSKAKEKPAAPPNKNWEEIAHLWRDTRDRNLIFQIEDDYYKRGNDLTPKERNILLKVVMDFYRWLEPPTAARPPASADNAKAPITPPPAQPPASKFSPSKMIADAIQSDVPKATDQPMSIVAQIDAILQRRLKAKNMQKWAVRLAEFPNRGMVVLVGLEQYESIDSVPYKRVREVIHASVAEWEQSAANDQAENQPASI